MQGRSQNARGARSRFSLAHPSPFLTPQRINLGKLDMASLRRYRARYQLPEPGPDSTKDQLVLAVAEHFMSQRVNEHDVLASFLMAAKRRRAT